MGFHPGDPVTASATCSRELPQPVTLGGMRGWVHPASARRGVLMVGAQGFEAFCAYQSWRVLADLLSGAGLTAVRFDLPGEGDALGDPRDPERVDTWIRSIRTWHDWMRNSLGIEQVDVVGFRLGALLAKAALWDVANIRKFVLLAPPRSGAAYARELRVAALLASETKPGSGVGEQGVDLCGHVLTPATLRSLSALGDWTSTSAMPDRMVLVASVEADPVAEQVAAKVGQFSRVPFDGLPDLLVGPTASRTPWQTFDQAVRWCSAGDVAGEENLPPAADPALAARGYTGRLAGRGFSETVCRFGRANHLTGILCLPDGPRAQVPPVLFLNSGANPHFGWARSHVDQARALAADGIASLRLDASGIGDSIWFRTGPRPCLYSAEHAADIRDAVDALIAERSLPPVLVGLCAGAFAAIKALDEDARITRAIAINPLRLLWHEHDILDEAERALTQSAGTYAAKLTSLRDWRRLMSGRIRPQKILAAGQLLAGKARRRVESALFGKAGISVLASPDTKRIRAIFETFSRRGARLSLMYSQKDAGREELERHFGAGGRLLPAEPAVTLSILPDADHELTPHHARQLVLARIKAVVLEGL